MHLASISIACCHVAYVHVARALVPPAACACYFKPTAYVRASMPARITRPGCPSQPRPEQQLDKCMPRGVNLSRGWRNLLEHAGGIWGWNNWGPKQVSEYSLGMRQRLFQEFGNKSGVWQPAPNRAFTSRRPEWMTLSGPIRSTALHLLVTAGGFAWQRARHSTACRSLRSRTLCRASRTCCHTSASACGSSSIKCRGCRRCCVPKGNRG